VSLFIKCAKSHLDYERLLSAGALQYLGQLSRLNQLQTGLGEQGHGHGCRQDQSKNDRYKFISLHVTGGHLGTNLYYPCSISQVATSALACFSCFLAPDFFSATVAFQSHKRPS
jgi:hypothetical protein